jgi:hypothetical protein
MYTLATFERMADTLDTEIERKKEVTVAQLKLFLLGAGTSGLLLWPVERPWLGAQPRARALQALAVWTGCSTLAMVIIPTYQLSRQREERQLRENALAWRGSWLCALAQAALCSSLVECTIHTSASGDVSACVMAGMAGVYNYGTTVRSHWKAAAALEKWDGDVQKAIVEPLSVLEAAYAVARALPELTSDEAYEHVRKELNCSFELSDIDESSFCPASEE